MARSLTEVIDKMLAVIPESEGDLRAELDKCKASAGFCPPEEMSRVWGRTTHTLIYGIGEPTEPWQFEVRRIFNGP